SGPDRYNTSALITQKAFPNTTLIQSQLDSKSSLPETAFLVSGESPADALSAGPAAIKENAPLLLTLPDRIPESIKSELLRLKVKNVVIVGGTSVIGSQVEAELSSLGITFTRIAGANRFETNQQLNSKYFPSAKSAIYVSG
ncbi:cell wall-binding repeat-containing protein, partial [Mycoplasmopsis arginini]|uniref:cell wall-binding repeat-containing protein n=1 Tax=Mycoplasmopsis arginini TaxID=2094 RepID=UPI00249E8344